jgi:phosphohistidine phosphatase SixA
MKLSLSLLTFLSATLVLAQSPTSLGTIFLVRHAEKVSEAQDALLSRVGEQRAACLAQTLRDAHIGAIYVTQVQRTQQTAEPLARSLAIKPMVIKADDAASLVSKVRQDLSKESVLVVGHSDTLPKVLSVLGVTGAPAVGHDDYDLLFVVNDSANHPELTTLHYCPSLRQAAASQGSEKMRRMR